MKTEGFSAVGLSDSQYHLLNNLHTFKYVQNRVSKV